MAARVHNSIVIKSPLEKVWSVIRPLDFLFASTVWNARVEGKDDTVDTVGSTRTVFFSDLSTKQTLRVLELSDINHTLSWEVIESVPAVKYSSAIHTVRCARVTETDTTFVEWFSDFSSDATAEVTEDTRFKQQDYLAGIARESAKASAQVEYLTVDLGSLKSVRKMAEDFSKKNLPLHILINNAGIMATPQGVTTDGFELQFGTNHIGHALLTLLLLPIIKKSGTAKQAARIIVLSSGAHRYSGVIFDDIMFTKPGSYEKWKSYGQSKTANILFAKQLQIRLNNEGAHVVVNAVHPGVIDTNLTRHATDDDKKLSASRFPMRKKTMQQGAATTCTAATSLDEAFSNPKSGGNYCLDCNVGLPLPHARDLAAAEKLWEVTDKLIASVGISSSL